MLLCNTLKDGRKCSLETSLTFYKRKDLYRSSIIRNRNIFDEASAFRVLQFALRLSQFRFKENRKMQFVEIVEFVVLNDEKVFKFSNVFELLKNINFVLNMLKNYHINCKIRSKKYMYLCSLALFKEGSTIIKFRCPLNGNILKYLSKKRIT